MASTQIFRSVFFFWDLKITVPSKNDPIVGKVNRRSATFDLQRSKILFTNWLFSFKSQSLPSCFSQPMIVCASPKIEPTVLDTHMRTMVLEYLPTKLGHVFGVNVGVHLPAPWFASGWGAKKWCFIGIFLNLWDLFLSHLKCLWPWINDWGTTL